MAQRLLSNDYFCYIVVTLLAMGLQMNEQKSKYMILGMMNTDRNSADISLTMDRAVK